MADTTLKSKVIVDVDDYEHVPCCSHGPALLFKRTTKKNYQRKFFACSAFRDRKLCPFFQWADASKKMVEESISCDSTLDHLSLHNRTSCIRRPLNHLRCTLIGSGDLNNVVTVGLSLQYVVIHRIHEVITVKGRCMESRMSSFLLDMDARYAHVYGLKKMSVYNMFNHHFFHSTGKQMFNNFLRKSSTGLVILIDPPFGGLVDPLVNTLNKIKNAWNAHLPNETDLPILWFFPYFMEKRICSSSLGLSMLDYKVRYDNLPGLRVAESDQGRKRSTVRIFTSIAQAKFVLPESEGYWFCDICQRYSSPENKHCVECQCCTSKDGTIYWHCCRCQRCVKLSHVHCDICDRCRLPAHTCLSRGQVMQINGGNTQGKRSGKAINGKAPKRKIAVGANDAIQ